jgi:hypothetical protein
VTYFRTTVIGSTIERQNRPWREWSQGKSLAEVQLREKENALQAAVVEKRFVLNMSGARRKFDILQGNCGNMVT